MHVFLQLLQLLPDWPGLPLAGPAVSAGSAGSGELLSLLIGHLSLSLGLLTCLPSLLSYPKGCLPGLQGFLTGSLTSCLTGLGTSHSLSVPRTCPAILNARAAGWMYFSNREVNARESIAFSPLGSPLCNNSTQMDDTRWPDVERRQG